MHRLNAAFLAVVVASAAVGAGAAVQFGGDLRAVSTVVAVEDRVDVVVTATALTERGVEVRARVDNPTGFQFRVPGGSMRVRNATDAGLAFGAARRLDDDGEVLPPKGSLSVRLLLSLSPDQRRRLSAAVAAGDAVVGVGFPVYYGDTRFTVAGQAPLEANASLDGQADRGGRTGLLAARAGGEP